ncbi:MAG TPA: hypothetical protein VHB25_12155 [Gemmatimonadaceae bacterium]|nr:hypothetical protein [Gemmatimonadaceae bacterium]
MLASSTAPEAPMYQSGPHTLVVGRTDPDAFVRDLQQVARNLLVSVLGMSNGERQFLHDVARGEGRYQMKALQRLVALSRRSLRPEHREALAEVVRRESLVDVESVRDIALAFDLETTAQAAADPAQRQFERFPSRATQDRVREALTTQLYATRAALDAVEAFPAIRP